MTTPDRTDLDVLIVGAGPAGMACAAALLESTDLVVGIVDAGHEVGGQYWRQPAPTSGAGGIRPDAQRYLHHDLDTYAALRATLDQGRGTGRFSLWAAHHVWSVSAQPVSAQPAGTQRVGSTEGGYAAHAVERARVGRGRGVTLTARALVIATGAYDRSLPFPGWDLPGVMTAGALQALLKANDVIAGQRVAVGGTGPFLLPVAAGLARRGATVVGVFEANRPTTWLRELRPVRRNAGKLGEGAGYAATLLRHRVPVRTGRMIIAAHGTDRVEAVSVARLDAAGHPVVGTTERVGVDAVGVGWGFTPQLDLALTLGVGLTGDVDGAQVVAVDHVQRTSRARVYAAGETCGIGGAALAVVEGRLAAHGVALDLVGRADVFVEGPLQLAAERLRGFAGAMQRAHPTPAGWADVLTPDTTVCRCEEVDAGAVLAAIRDRGAGDARQVKQLTRAGMGWCQGRVCGYASSLLSCGAPGEAIERLISAPVPLGVVAAETDPHPNSAM